MRHFTFQKFLLIFILTVIGLGIVMFVFRSVSSEESAQANPTPTYLPANVPQTSLWFETNPDEYTSESIPVEVYISAEENKVTGVQLELSYDPKVLKFVSLTPVDLLGGRQELIKEIDEKTGRITYAAGSRPGQSTIQGTDEIVKLVFKPVGRSSEVRETAIKILPETLVTALGVKESVLIKTTDIEVIVRSGL